MAAPSAAPPFDEARRLATLRALDLLDVPREGEFDALVALAAEVLGCPTSLFNLIDHDRQWAMAVVGAADTQCSREHAFCDHTIRGDRLMVVEDAAADPRFAHNPMVTGPGGIRFYAGMPIHARDRAGVRRAIGAICVVDAVPRTLTPEQEASLQRLAMIAEALIQARADARRATATARLAERQSAKLRLNERRFAQAERMAMIGAWRVSLETERVEWSDGVYRIHGLPVGEMPLLEHALAFYPPHARGEVTGALAQTIEHGTPFAVEVDFVTAIGEQRRVRSIGELETTDGRPSGVVGVFQDVTERYRLECALRDSAERDELTGIANRGAFNRVLEAAMAAARAAGERLVLALVDLDGFKAINDTLGHLAGDDVLRAVGKRLGEPWLQGSVAARLGGDEFALIVRDPKLTADPSALVARLEVELCVPVVSDGVTIAVAGTVGALPLADERTVRDFVHVTDAALYRAKRRRIGEGRRQERRAAG